MTRIPRSVKGSTRSTDAEVSFHVRNDGSEVAFGTIEAVEKAATVGAPRETTPSGECAHTITGIAKQSAKLSVAIDLKINVRKALCKTPLSHVAADGFTVVA